MQPRPAVVVVEGIPALILSTLAREWKSSASAKETRGRADAVRHRGLPRSRDTHDHDMPRVGRDVERRAPAGDCTGAASSPVMDGAVLEAVEGQVGRLVREACRGLLVELDAEAGLLAGVEVPSSKVNDCRNTSLVSGPCCMYSWMPKLWIARSRCSAAAIPTGEMSVGPWMPDLIWYCAA